MQKDEHYDEIDLRALLLILRRHFKLFSVVTLLVTVLGSVWGLTRPQQFNYQQSIQLAHYYSEGQLVAIQSAKQVVQQIENIYLPAFQQRYNQQHPHQTITLIGTMNKFSANKNNGYHITIGDNGFLYLQVTGNQQFAEIVSQINQFIFEKIVTQQATLRAALTKHLQTQIKIFKQGIPVIENLFAERSNKAFNAQGLMGQNSLANSPNDIVNLKIQLADLQQQMVSMQSAKLDALIVIEILSQISMLTKIILSFLVGLFLGFFVVFIKNSID